MSRRDTRTLERSTAYITYEVVVVGGSRRFRLCAECSRCGAGQFTDSTSEAALRGLIASLWGACQAKGRHRPYTKIEHAPYRRNIPTDVTLLTEVGLGLRKLRPDIDKDVGVFSRRLLRQLVMNQLNCGPYPADMIVTHCEEKGFIAPAGLAPNGYTINSDRLPARDQSRLDEFEARPHANDRGDDRARG